MLMALGGVGRRSPAPTNSSLTPCAFRASCPSVTPIPEVRHEIAFHKNWWFVTALANACTFALRVGGRRSLAFRNWHRGGNRGDAYCSRQPHFHAIAQWQGAHRRRICRERQRVQPLPHRGALRSRLRNVSIRSRDDDWTFGPHRYAFEKRQSAYRGRLDGPL